MELKDLFMTISQISFTITGLMFIGLTLDDDTRKFWFTETNSIYVNLNLATLLLPGLISLGGLIPQVPLINIPSWMLMTLLIGVLYLYLALAASRLRKDPKYQGFKELEKQFGDVTRGLWFYSLCLLGLCIGIIGTYASRKSYCIELAITLPNLVVSQAATENQLCNQLIESFIGFVLVGMVISGVGPVFRFVRSYSEVKKNKEGISPSLPLVDDRNKTLNSNLNRNNPNQEIPPSPRVIAVMVAIICFILGIAFSNTRTKPNKIKDVIYED